MAKVEIRFDADGWKAFRQSVDRDGGAVAPCDFEPTLFQRVPIEISVNGTSLVTLEGEVVHFTPPDQAALMFDDTARQEIAKAGRRLQRRSANQMDDEPVWARIQNMNKAEKMKLARHGTQVERRALLKERDVSLHLQVLNNPGLTAKEVAGLVRGGGVSAAFIRKVTERRDLMGNRSVVEALVINPLTPTNIAVRLVERIPTETARRIARSGNYKPQVVAACKKRVTR